MRDAVDAGKNDKQEPPRLVRGIEPSASDRTVERRVCPEVVCRRSQHHSPQRTAIGAGAKAARQRRANRDAFGDEIENRRRRRDVGVQPAPLDSAIAPRGAPLCARALPFRRTASIEPTNARNAHAAGIASEEEGDVGDPGGGRKHRRPRSQAAGLDDPAGEIREVPTREQVPQHIGPGAVDEHENDSHCLRIYDTKAAPASAEAADVACTKDTTGP